MKLELNARIRGVPGIAGQKWRTWIEASSLSIRSTTRFVKALLIMALRQRDQQQARIAKAAAKSESAASRDLARAGLSKLRALAPREPVQRNELVAPQDIPQIEAEVASGGGQKSVQFHRLKQ